MRNRERYGKNWRKRARACKERAGWLCQKCGVKHGTERVSWSGNLWPVYLQAAHVEHDPENLEAALVAVCPWCHWHFYRKPGTRPAWMIERMKHRRLILVAYLV
jgi:hypothetical protein